MITVLKSLFISLLGCACLVSSTHALGHTSADFDFPVKCRLSGRTELTDPQGKVLAVLGSDTFVSLESLISNSGWISLTNYIAQPSAGSTIAVSLSTGTLRTVADSTLLGEPLPGSSSILGIIRAGQEFRILETKEGIQGTERVLFHKIDLRGNLQFPIFKDCQRNLP
jgi:hypothetical protein